MWRFLTARCLRIRMLSCAALISWLGGYGKDATWRCIAAPASDGRQYSRLHTGAARMGRGDGVLGHRGSKRMFGARYTRAKAVGHLQRSRHSLIGETSPLRSSWILAVSDRLTSDRWGAAVMQTRQGERQSSAASNRKFMTTKLCTYGW